MDLEINQLTVEELYEWLDEVPPDILDFIIDSVETIEEAKKNKLLDQKGDDNDGFIQKVLANIFNPLLDFRNHCFSQAQN